jgi:hypothetical protein
MGILFYVVSLLLFAPLRAWAHRPYEHIAGTFDRADGKVLTIVERHVDGIVVADPVSIQFRHADGTELAHTSYVSDAVLRRTTSGIQIYQFSTTWLPIAGRIDLFDGYSLTNITSSKRQWFSLLVHIAGHWTGYLATFGFGALFLLGWLGIRAIPKRGWLTALRMLGFVCVGFATAIYLLILLYAPISPVVLLVLGSPGVLVYRVLRSRLQRAPTAG